MVDPDILQAQGLSLPRAGADEAPESAEISGEDGPSTIWLFDQPGKGVPAVAARLTAPHADALRPLVELRAIDLQPGPEAWQLGKVQIRSYDESGRFNRYWPKDITTISGNLKWREFSKIIPIPDERGGIYFVAYNAGVSGVMGLRNVRIAGLAERPAFVLVESALILLWGFAAVVLGGTLVRGRGRLPSTYGFLVLAALALAGTLAPQPYFAQFMEPLEGAAKIAVSVIDADAGHHEMSVGPSTAPDPVADAPPAGSDWSPRNAGGEPDHGIPHPSSRQVFDGLTLKQVGHFTVFLLLAVLTGFAFRSARWWVVLWNLGVFAVATESLQFFLITRSSQVLDVAVDGAGIAAGYGLIVLAGRLGGRRASASNPAPR